MTTTSSEPARLGTKIRALRRRESLSQVQLAERLGISASYLNLIEHDRRPLPAMLLIKLAQLFHIDVQALAADDDRQLVADTMEVLGDDLFEGQELTQADVREFVTSTPAVARSMLTLYQAYRQSRQSVDSLAAQLDADSEQTGVPGVRLPSEEVSDFIQRHVNHFPELEEAAERLWREAHLDSDDLYAGMARHLRGRHGIEIQVEHTSAMRGAMRRYERERKRLLLSEALPRGSRNFQLDHQLGLLVHSEVLDRLTRSDQLTTDDSRALCRVALANYFGAAVSMPYQPFFEAARAERYDIELLGHRFGASFEQVCHRLTTLRRPGAEGIPFHLVRIDIAGNISKRFSASGIRFARFSGACPRWNVHTAFLTPGMIRVQLSQMPDGRTYFCIARTLRRDRRFHAPPAVQAIGMGCDVRYARELVYADGINLDTLDAAVPVGVSCRLCPRMDCQQRAFPAIQHRLEINEDVRGLSFYAPVTQK
jgi:predicted transcriptional regulator/transcriptional regulator with XRE-family HTH domain